METELEQLRAENERLKMRQEKILRLLATHLPFEVRTHLNSIRGLAELVKKDSENLTEQQHEYLDGILSANNYMYCAIELITDYSRHGFRTHDVVGITSLACFGSMILKPSTEIFTQFGEEAFKAAENYSVDVNQFGLKADSMAIKAMLVRIFSELFSYHLVDQIKLEISNSDNSFLIHISAPNELRPEPLYQTIYQNDYEEELTDWAVQAIVELYGGEVRSSVVDEIIQIQIAFPLVEVDY